jgi:hypothetical protein
VEFVRWDDTKEPVVRFSTNASVAYVAVEKLVLKEKLPTGLGKPDTSRFAWISIYKKGQRVGIWMLLPPLWKSRADSVLMYVANQ